MSADGGQVGGGSILTEGAGAPQGGQASGTGGGGNVGAGGAVVSTPNGNGNGADWRWESLDEDLRNDPALAPYQTTGLSGLAKSHVNLNKLLGGEKIPRPRSDDDAEGWDRWYKASGRPDKGEEYEFKRPDSLPDGFYDEEAEKSFRTWAHVNGLSKRQAGSLYENYVKTRLEQHQAWQTSQKQAQEQGINSLKREWGQQYDQKVSSARKALQAYADPDYYKYLDESGAGNDPRMIRAWARIGEKMTGSTRLEGAPQVDGGSDPMKDIGEFRAKHDAALHDKRHPDHELRVKQYNKLFEKAYGTGPANK